MNEEDTSINTIAEDIIKNLREAATGVWRPNEPEKIVLKDNSAADAMDQMIAVSEKAYISIAQNIVEISHGQIREQNISKNRLKFKFTRFFIWFISLQYLVLSIILLSENFFNYKGITDTVLITYISSVFAETLGAIVIMIKYAFDSKQEVTILDILNGVISSYQKFH